MFLPICVFVVGCILFYIGATRLHTSGIRLVHRPQDKWPYDVETKRVLGWRIEQFFSDEESARDFMTKYHAGITVRRRFGAGTGVILVEMKD